MSHDNRRLTEKEIQQVFRRSAELQESRGEELAEWGPTPADVIKLGEELGMDSGSLRTAMDEVLAGKAAKGQGSWARMSFESDRNYNTELTEDEWHEIVQKLRGLFGRTGTVSEVAGAREWDGSQAVLDPIHLSARSKGGSTRVSIKSDLYGAAFIVGLVSFFPLLLVALAVTKATDLPASTELLISAGIFVTAAAVWGKLVGWMSGRRRRAIIEVEQQIDQLVDRLAESPIADVDEASELRIRT